MAKEYKMRPTDLLGESHLHESKRFHLDFDIMAATNHHLDEHAEAAEAQHDPTSSRVSGPGEQRQMVQGQEQRAKQSDQMQQAGMKAPSPSGQMQKLDEVIEQRTPEASDGT